MTALRSRKYLAGSKGATCKLRIAEVCQGGTDTVIPAHIRDRHTGRSVKASDMSVSDACFACHEVFDRRAKLPSGEYLSEADWHFYALRGLQDTLEARVEAGLVFVPLDPPKPFHDRPAAKRKPPEQRAKIPHGETKWGSRKIQSRPIQRKGERA